MFFTPKWKKEALLLAKGARKFVHYKRDLLKPDRIEEIESRRSDLLAAAKAGDQAKTDEASKQLRATCEGALPFQAAQTWLEENVEVMFVAIVIALGLRAYFLQPFRIPTGSMQPTLNGIISTRQKERDWPALPTRLAEMVMRGRSYVKIVNDRPRQIAVDNSGQPVVRDVQVLHFFTRSDVCFTDGSTLRLPGPANQVSILLRECLETARKNGGRLNAGDVVCEGYVDSGDLVLVDRISYHFRNPRRGEVFVFDTRAIPGTRHQGSDASEVTHYIKRLCALPGDALSIQPPHLLINGRITNERGILNVYEKIPVRNSDGIPVDGRTGYILPDPRHANVRLDQPDKVLNLSNTGKPEWHGYAALGDNTGNSLDSRYWGPVNQFNLVGPGLFTLWPITTGHWGVIH